MDRTHEIEAIEVFALIATGIATLVVLAIFVAALWRATAWQ